ncbi:hypothetical protein J7K28_07695 [Candidatus Aerophobetes bacterium]|nr:hypothetical protein [Candidatus Aerophobetes bacterium]
METSEEPPGKSFINFGVGKIVRGFFAEIKCICQRGIPLFLSISLIFHSFAQIK